MTRKETLVAGGSHIEAEEQYINWWVALYIDNFAEYFRSNIAYMSCNYSLTVITNYLQ